mmetsp:Transcript_19415/g.57538  ORF Transcript_19415/g.57538 Transcript_19415/m.57538 type:complete len:208 (-) Transcript_19415:705-1328(-)
MFAKGAPEVDRVAPVVHPLVLVDKGQRGGQQIDHLAGLPREVRLQKGARRRLVAPLHAEIGLPAAVAHGQELGGDDACADGNGGRGGEQQPRRREGGAGELAEEAPHPRGVLRVAAAQLVMRAERQVRDRGLGRRHLRGVGDPGHQVRRRAGDGRREFRLVEIRSEAHAVAGIADHCPRGRAVVARSRARSPDRPPRPAAVVGPGGT